MDGTLTYYKSDENISWNCVKGNEMKPQKKFSPN